MIGRRPCAACAAKDQTIELLKSELAHARENERRLTDRLVALTSPNALAVARLGEQSVNPAGIPISYDPEHGHAATLHGEEIAVVMKNNVPHTQVGNHLVPLEDARIWMDGLMSYSGGGEVEPEEIAGG